MKKLLLTLFAVAAVFVACDKDALDQDVSNINVLEQAEEINASLDIDFDYDALVARLTGKNLSSSDKSDKGSASTARNTGTNVACGDDERDGLTIDGETDYITYELATINGNNYGVIRSEELTRTAAFTPVATITFVNKGSGLTKIFVNGEYVNEFTSVPFGNLYADSALRTSADVPFAYIENLNSNFIYIGDGTAASAGLSCIYAGQYYEVTPAPFPLNGFLATLRGALPTGMDSANYAGTTEAAVRAAIEADIIN